MIDWEKCTKDDLILIDKLVTRFKKELPDFVPPGTMAMDLTAVHVSGCKLQLQNMLTAKASDFVHDCIGINNHINRTTGELMDCFLPRYAV